MLNGYSPSLKHRRDTLDKEIKNIFYNSYVLDSCEHQKPDLIWIKQKISQLARSEKYLEDADNFRTKG